MKKIIITALFLLLIKICAAETFFPTSGRWFKFSQKGYTLKVADLSVIIKSIEKGEDIVWLNIGCKAQILHPQDWLTLVIQCYQAIDNTVNNSNIIDAINNSQLFYWGDDISVKVKNYYWGENGGTYFINDYNGFAADPSGKIPVILYKGYPVMKMTCGNPLLNTITITKPNGGNNKPQDKPQPQTRPQADQQGDGFGNDGVNVITVTPGGTDNFPSYGNDGINVAQRTRGGNNCQASYGSGKNVNTYTHGGHTHQEPISGGTNVNYYTQGGQNHQEPLSGGTNVITYR